MKLSISLLSRLYLLSGCLFYLSSRLYPLARRLYFHEVPRVIDGWIEI